MRGISLKILTMLTMFYSLDNQADTTWVPINVGDITTFIPYTPTGTFAAPANAQLIDVGGVTRLSWDNIEHASQYEIQGLNAAGQWVSILTTDALFAVIDNRFQGFTNIRVTACTYNSCTSSGSWSAQIALQEIASDFIENVPVTAVVHIPAENILSTEMSILPGSFNVTNQGAAGYTIPFEVPTGIANYQPELAINYSSLGGNGLAGVGWNVSATSSIQRCQKTLEEDGLYQEIFFDNRDALCLGGQKLRLVSGTNLSSGSEYRLDGNSAVKIVQTNSEQSAYFTLYRPSGEQVIYGNSDNSLQIDVVTNARYAWLQASSSNIFGQQIEYVYHRAVNYVPLLSEVNYAGNQINFVYEDRPDASTHYYLGNTQITDSRLQGVLVRNHSNTLVRSYHLSYHLSEFSSRSLLDDVRMCNGSLNSNCGLLTEFNYSDHNLSGLQDNDYVINLSDYTAVDASSTFCGSESSPMSGYCSTYKLQVSDLDGDGKREILVSTHKGNVGKVLAFSYDVQELNYNSSLSVLNADLLRWDYRVSGQPRVYNFPWQVTDVDGNGIRELTFDTKTRYDWNGDGIDQITPGSTLGMENFASSFYRGNNDGEEYIVFPNGYSTHLSDIPLDINGDGLIDRVVPMQGFDVYYNHQSGETSYTHQDDYYVPSINRTVNNVYAEELLDTGNYDTTTARFDVIDVGSLLSFGDINGDGNSDMVSVDGVIQINSGRNFKKVSDTDFAFDSDCSIWYSNRTDCLAGLVDINGDGKDDLVHVDNGNVFWQPSQSTQSADARLLTSVNWGETKKRDHSYQWTDIDGDNQPELVFYNHITQQIRIRFDSNTENEILDKLTSISTGLGKTHNIEYKRLTDSSVYEKGTGASSVDWGNGTKVRDIVSSMAVVAQVTESTALSQTGQVLNDQTDYFYKGLKTQAGGKGSLGFAEVISTLQSNQITTTKTFRQDAPFDGQVSRTTLEHNGTLLQDTEILTWWNLATNNSQSHFVAPRTVSAKQYYANASNGIIGSSQLASTTTTETTLEVTTSGYVQQSNINVSVQDNIDFGSSSQTTELIYNDEDLTNWRIKRPTLTTKTFTRAGQDNVNQVTEIIYNTDGSVQQKINAPNSTDKSLYLRTYLSYDNVGNIIEKTLCSLHFSTNCSGSTVENTNTDNLKVFRRQTFTYDNDNRYLLSVSNPNYVEQALYSYNKFGLPQEIRTNQYDNRVGQREYRRYNSLGELYFNYNNQGASTHITKQLCSNRTDCPANAVIAVSTSTASQPNNVTYIDFAGRTVRTKTQLLTGAWSISDTFYDERGRTTAVSKPYIGVTRYLDTMSYDALDRKYTVNSADSLTTRFTYNAGVISQSLSGSYQDEASSTYLDRVRSEQRNGRGEVTSSTDSNYRDTEFVYNALSLLHTVTGVDNASTHLTYDSYGRRTVMNDPDKGIITFGVNALGEAISRASEDGVVKKYYRNSVGQTIKTTTVKGATNLSYYFDYGNSPLLQSQYVGSAKTTFSYDNYHRSSGQLYQIDGKSWNSSTHYDQYGRLFREMDISGNGRGQQYQYANGSLNRIFEVKTGQVYYRMLAVDAYQNLTAAEVGQQIRVDRGYNPKSGRLTSLIAANGVIQNQNYRYDQLGNLRYRSNHNAFGSIDLVESFGYDILNRLETVTFNNVLGQQVSYFDNGNIRTKSDVQSGSTYQYGTNTSQCNIAPGVHAVTQINTQSFCYDARGNQTKRYNSSTLTRSVDYALFDKPLTIWSSQGESRFEYDASEMMVKRIDKKSTGDTTTYYVGGHEVILQADGSNEIKRYIQDFAIHTIKSNGNESMNYVFNDHLGSGSVITNAAGVVVETASFDAFGKRRNANNWQALTNPFSQLTNLSALLNITQKGFTGHVQVDHASIIHMGGRIYDPEIGRFIQADPIVEDPRDAQTLNRYSYVLNNPLSYTDPTGYRCITDTSAKEKCNDSVDEAENNSDTATTVNGGNSSSAEVDGSTKDAALANSASKANGTLGAFLEQRGVDDSKSSIIKGGVWIIDNLVNPIPEVLESIDSFKNGDYTDAGISIGMAVIGKKVKAAGEALENGFDFVTKRTGPIGVDPKHHNANVMVRDANGNILSHDRLVSGNMTTTEKALGFPKNTLASHTEARAVTHTTLRQGDTMTITGQLPPCNSCKGYMNRAVTETGAAIKYQWRQNGSTQTWQATKKK
jgi:RHS repeat-associated protein